MGKVPPSKRPSPLRPPPSSPSEKARSQVNRRLWVARLQAWPITVEDVAGSRLPDVFTWRPFLKVCIPVNRCRFPPKTKGREVEEAGCASPGGVARWGPSVTGLPGQLLGGLRGLGRVQGPQGALLAPDHLFPLAQVIPGTRKAETGPFQKGLLDSVPTPPTA